LPMQHTERFNLVHAPVLDRSSGTDPRIPKKH
jgi:hypothetical protein